MCESLQAAAKLYFTNFTVLTQTHNAIPSHILSSFCVNFLSSENFPLQIATAYHRVTQHWSPLLPITNHVTFKCLHPEHRVYSSWTFNVKVIHPHCVYNIIQNADILSLNTTLFYSYMFQLTMVAILRLITKI